MIVNGSLGWALAALWLSSDANRHSMSCFARLGQQPASATRQEQQQQASSSSSTAFRKKLAGLIVSEDSGDDTRHSFWRLGQTQQEQRTRRLLVLQPQPQPQPGSFSTSAEARNINDGQMEGLSTDHVFVKLAAAAQQQQLRQEQEQRSGSHNERHVSSRRVLDYEWTVVGEEEPLEDESAAPSSSPASLDTGTQQDKDEGFNQTETEVDSQQLDSTETSGDDLTTALNEENGEKDNNSPIVSGDATQNEAINNYNSDNSNDNNNVSEEYGTMDNSTTVGVDNSSQENGVVGMNTSYHGQEEGTGSGEELPRPTGQEPFTESTLPPQPGEATPTEDSAPSVPPSVTSVPTTTTTKTTTTTPPPTVEALPVTPSPVTIPEPVTTRTPTRAPVHAPTNVPTTKNKDDDLWNDDVVVPTDTQDETAQKKQQQQEEQQQEEEEQQEQQQKGEEIVTEKELAQEERKVKVLSASGVILGVLAMIFTAYQMSENPDGIYAAACRFCITVVVCLFRIVLSPCKGWLGYSNHRHMSHYGHVPVDYGYRDPTVELQLQ